MRISVLAPVMRTTAKPKRTATIPTPSSRSSPPTVHSVALVPSPVHVLRIVTKAVAVPLRQHKRRHNRLRTRQALLRHHHKQRHNLFPTLLPVPTLPPTRIPTPIRHLLLQVCSMPRLWIIREQQLRARIAPARAIRRIRPV